MQEEQFDELNVKLSTIEDNTSWTWHVNNELEGLNKRAKAIENLLEENNELLQQLIEAIGKNR